MIKKFTTLIIFLVSAHFIYAQPVSESTAKDIARNFLIGESGSTSRVDTDLELVYKISSSATNSLKGSEPERYFYVFNSKSNTGFVIVAGDEKAFPILGYSDQSTFDEKNIPTNLAKWLEGYKNEIRNVIGRKAKPSEDICEQWKNLKDGNIKNNSVARTKTAAPLIQTKWDQSPYYNELCPFDTKYNDRTVTGCVAIAMAQIMKYWEYPTHGSGFHTYNHSNYGTLSANFAGTNYQWASMPNGVIASNNSVATLMYHCGVSLDMNYGVAATGGSSTNSLQPVANSLKNYFQYSSSVEFVYKSDYSHEGWISLIRAELDAGRPIEYAGIGTGGGHAFVCDGYDDNNYFHFNWGWGGQSDGYFF